MGAPGIMSEPVPLTVSYLNSLFSELTTFYVSAYKDLYVVDTQPQFDNRQDHFAFEARQTATRPDDVMYFIYADSRHRTPLISRSFVHPGTQGYPDDFFFLSPDENATSYVYLIERGPDLPQRISLSKRNISAACCRVTREECFSLCLAQGNYLQVILRPISPPYTRFFLTLIQNLPTPPFFERNV